MKKIVKSFIALLFPWLIFLINDNPGAALVALIMQCSMIGWPFAVLWAFRYDKENKSESTHQTDSNQ